MRTKAKLGAAKSCLFDSPFYLLVVSGIDAAKAAGRGVQGASLLPVGRGAEGRSRSSHQGQQW